MIVELLEAVPAVSKDEDQYAVEKRSAAHRSLEESLAPFPPPATEDDAHKLPKQQNDDQKGSTAVAVKQEPSSSKDSGSTSSSAKPAAAAASHDSFSPYGNSGSRLTEKPKELQPRVDTRSDFPVPGGGSKHQSQWFLRLLVDHREISILPFDEYKHVREAYRVKDWKAECKQQGTEPLPAHQW